jgi:hypothetical protein
MPIGRIPSAARVFSEVAEVLSTARDWHVRCCKPRAMSRGIGALTRRDTGVAIRLSIWSVIPLLLLSPSPSPAENVLPPPQEAGSPGAQLRITHTHHAVRACRLEPPTADLRCAAQLEPADAATRLALRPIPRASLERRADARRVIEVSLAPGRPTSAMSMALAPGLWEVYWPSHYRQPRFNAKPGDKIELTLETTTGRCDAERHCALVPDASTARVHLTQR